jgi:hypothetical protein
MSEAIYHPNCRTIKWLKTHCRLNYDPIDQCLTYKRNIYISPEKRRLLVDILTAHTQFKRDIVTRTGTETIIWKCQEVGRLIKVRVRSQQEVDLVGSYAWRKAHGLADDTEQYKTAK